MVKEILDAPTRRVSITDITGSDFKSIQSAPKKGLTQGDEDPIRRVSIKDIEGRRRDPASSLIFPGSTAKYDKILGKDKYHPELGPTYNEQLLHENQTVAGQFANFLGQVGAEIIGGSIEGAGYILDLGAGARLANDSQVEFGNMISNFGAGIKERSREAMPIYIDPYKEGKFDPGSFSWWMSNGVSVASTISLMIPSMMATKGVMMLGDIAKITSGLGRTGRVATQGITQAMFSRHAENLMEASGVYKENYEKYLNSGLSEKEARELASLAASNTYNKQWALLVQDIPQYILFNKLGALKGGAGAATAKDMSGKMADWLGKSRLATTAGKTGAVAMDMAGQGAEEIYQFLINEQSNLMAHKQANPGKEVKHSVWDVLKNHYDDGEMWTSGFFGAIGAGVMQAGFAGLNRKVMGDVIKSQMETVAAFGVGLNQANKEYSTAMDSGDPIKASQALPSLIFQVAMKAKLNNSTEYIKEMLNELQNNEDPALFEKWGIDPETQGRLKQDPEFAKKILEGIDRVGNLYDRYLKENTKNSKIKRDQVEPSAQVMANTQFLKEQTEESLPLLEKRKDEAWGKIEDVEKLSGPGQQLVALEAQKRSVKKMIDHFEKAQKETEDTAGEIEKAERKEAIEIAGLELDRIENDIKETKKARTKEEVEADKDIVLPEDQVDAFRFESGRLEAARESIRQLEERLKRLREGSTVADLIEEIDKNLADAEQDKQDSDQSIQLGDKVSFEDEATGETISGVVEGVVDENTFVVQPLDKNGKPVGEAINKAITSIRLNEKENDQLNEEVAPDDISTPVSEREEADELKSTKYPMHNISKLSYSDKYGKIRNSALAEVLKDKTTSLTMSKAYYFLDTKNTDGLKNLKEHIAKYATKEQKDIFDKFLSGRELKKSEIDELVKTTSDKKYLDIVDMLPISVRVVIGGKNYEGGLFLHRSDYGSGNLEKMHIPSNTRRKGGLEIEKHKQNAYKETRKVREDLLRILLSGKSAYSENLNRSKKDYELVKLNRPFISEEHANILFDAFVLVGRVKAGKAVTGKSIHSHAIKFNKEDDRVSGLTAGEVIDLLVNNGYRMTEPNTPRFRNRNIKPGQAEVMANKRLYLAAQGKNVVLMYGNNQIDLMNPADIELTRERADFVKWITTNKRYAIYLKSKSLGLTLDGGFLGKKTFRIGKGDAALVRKGNESYKQFIINNKLVETDATRDDQGILHRGVRGESKNKSLKDVFDKNPNNIRMGIAISSETKPDHGWLEDGSGSIVKGTEGLMRNPGNIFAVLKDEVFDRDPVLSLNLTDTYGNLKVKVVGGEKTGNRPVENKPIAPAIKTVGNIISFEITKQGKELETVIRGESGKEFLLVFRQGGKIDLFSEKTKDNTFKTSVETPTAKQINNLVNKYIPSDLLSKIKQWQNVKDLKEEAKYEKEVLGIYNKYKTTSEVSSVVETPIESTAPKSDYQKTPDQIEQDRSKGKKKIEKEPTYKNRFSTKKERTIYSLGTGKVVANEDVIPSVSNVIEEAIKNKQKVDEVISRVGDFIRTYGVLISSKGPSRNKNVYDYIRDRFEGRTTNTLIEEWQIGKKEPLPEPVEDNVVPDIGVNDIEADEPTDIPEGLPSLDNILKNSPLFGGIAKQATTGPYKIADIHKEIQWAYDVVGIAKDDWVVKDKLVDLIYGGRKNFALYSQSAILLYRAAEEGTVYHEAFHRVTLGYFTENERKRLYRAARQIYNLSTDKYTDKQVDEFLADKFQQYVISNETRKAPGAVQGFFEKVLDFIKKVFFGNRRLNENEVDQLFRQINEGKFKDRVVLGENKNLLAPGEYMTKTIVGGFEFNTLNTRQEVKGLIKGLTEALFRVNNVTDPNDVGELKHGPLVSAIENLVEQFDGLANNENASEQDRLNAGHLREVYKEVLGVKNAETGIYDNYSYFIRPQMDSFLLSMGVKQKGIKDSDDQYLIERETDVGTDEQEAITEKAGKVGGNYTKASYEMNKKENALASMKFMIATLHELSHIDENTGERVFERNSMTQMGTFVDFSKTWSKVYNALYYLNHIDDMIDELKFLAEEENYSPFAELAERLENSSEMTKNQFVVTIHSSKHDFINFSAYVTESEGAKIKMNKSAFNDAYFSEVGVWNERFFMDDDIVKTGKSPDGLYRTYFKDEFFENLASDYEDLKIELQSVIDEVDNQKKGNRDSYIEKNTKEYIGKILDLLDRFNIVVDENTIRSIISDINGESIDNDLDRLSNYLITELRHIFSSSLPAAAAAESKQVDRKATELFKNTVILDLARAYIKGHPELISDMQLGPDKHIYNTFSEPSHATEVQNRINNEEEYVEKRLKLIYNKRSRLLNDLTDENSRKNFGLRTYSYLRVKEKGSNDKGRGFLQITELEDFLIKYSSMYNAEESLLPLPTLPRKTYFFMSGARKFGKVMVGYKDGTITFSKEVLDYFYDAYLDELERINNAIELREKYKNATGEEKESLKDDLVKNYHYSGDFNLSAGNAYNFIHFEGYEVNKKKDAKSQPRLSKAAFNNRINKTLNEVVKENLEYAMNIGAIRYYTNSNEYDPGMLDRTTVDEYTTEYESEHIGTIGAIADFALNYMMATVESEKVFLGDPAFFSKSKATGEVFEDLYKRWFGVGSSGEIYVETSESEQDTSYNVLVLNTQKFESKFYNALYDRHFELWTDYLTKNNKNKEDKDKLSPDKIIERAAYLAETRLSAYKDVDPTDGQAWISPTMYKSMLKRSGMFSPKVEEAFNLLMSEKELDSSERLKALNVVLNPQKTVYVGTQERNGLDVPIYDKMSMTVLFKGIVKDTPLEDLYNRMELEGKYANNDNLQKVHVVNFDSAIKIGGRRGYDLFDDRNTRVSTNDLTDVYTTKQYWKNLRKQQVTDPKDDFTSQTVGTQVYKVTSANIVKDQSYGEYETGMDLLNSLTKSRVALSNFGRNEIEATLGVKNGRMSNVNLIRMLRRDAESAKKSDDFINALKVDSETGRKYLELDAFPDRRWVYSRLMRLITENTVDLKTPGAQLIQSSDYGFTKIGIDEELIFSTLDEGSEVAHQSECRVSIRMFKHLINNYSKLTHEQRVAALKGLEIPLLGYRIPTQGQNSVVSLKIKEFLPDAAGDVIHLPLEFTALTGSDFDIDKLFVMFHNFEKNENGKLVKSTFDSDMSDAAVEKRYNKKIKELYQIYKKDQGVVSREVFDKLRSLGAHGRRNITDADILESINDIYSDSVVELRNALDEHGMLLDAYNKAGNNQVKDSIYSEILDKEVVIEDILSKNNLRESVREETNSIVEKATMPIKKEVLINAGKIGTIEEFSKLSIEEQNTSKANQNRIIDIFHTVIRDKKHHLSASQPLGGITDSLKKYASEVERKESGGKVARLGALRSTAPKYQSEAKFKFMTSDEGIGPFALMNAHHSLTQMANLKMKTSIKYDIAENGVVPLNLVVGRDNIYITDWLSTMIDAHVDALKDNYITKLNVNGATYGFVGLMLRLGYGMQTFEFVSQPILKEYAREYFNMGGRIKEEDEDGSDNGKIADRAFNRVRNRYLIKLGVGEGEEFSLADDNFKNYIPFEKLIKDKKNLDGDLNPDLKDNIDRNLRQLNVLHHFRKILKEDSDPLNKLVIESRIDTKQIGATPSEQRFTLNKLMEIEESGKFPGMKRLLDTSGEYTENGTMLSPLLKNSVLYMQDLLSDNTVYGSKGFDDLFWKVLYSIPGSSTMRISGINNIVEEMFTHFVGEFFGDPYNGIGMNKEGLEKLLLNGRTSVFAVLSKVRKKSFKQYEDLKNNRFLGLFRIDSKTDVPIETYLRIPFVSTADKWTNDDYIEDFLELFTYPDPDVKMLARELYLYAFYTTGFKPKFRGYVKHIPNSVSKELIMQGPDKNDLSKRAWNKVSFNEYIYNLINELNSNTATARHLHAIKRSVIADNWYNKWFVPDATSTYKEDGKPYYYKKDEVGLVELNINESSKYSLGKNTDGDNIYAHFITLKGVASYHNSIPTGAIGSEVSEMEKPFMDAEQDEVGNMQLGLFEFIGLNMENGNPIYKPINKKGFYEKGSLLKETGIRDRQSIVKQNNLRTQLSDTQVVKFAEQKIPAFKSIPFDNQQIVDRALVQKEEYVQNLAIELMEEQRGENKRIMDATVFDEDVAETPSIDVKKEVKIDTDNADIKSNPESLSNYAKPIVIYVDGSVTDRKESYGYGSWAEYNGKEYQLSGVKEDVDAQLKEILPENVFNDLMKQDQFNPSVELLGLINTLEQFQNTAEHLVIRQDYIGSVSYIGLSDRAKDDPHRQNWKAKQPHIRLLVDRAVSLIEKIEKNGGSVRIFYIPAHNNKAKWAEYVKKYSEQKEIVLNEDHVNRGVVGNNMADRLAGDVVKKNTFKGLVSSLETSREMGVKSGFEKTEREDEAGKDQKDNKCKK